MVCGAILSQHRPALRLPATSRASPTICLLRTKWYFRSWPAPSPSPGHAEVQHAAGSPVLQSGGTLRTHEPAGDTACSATSRPKAGRRSSMGRWARRFGLNGGSSSIGACGRRCDRRARRLGEGNTALWPPPDIRWPGVRGLLDRVDEQVSHREGQISGIKTFRFLVVPDSVDPLTFPAITYAYYDLATRGYRSAEVAAASLPVTAG